MNCAQVKEQLIDFLYDEMSPQARAAFTEHLRGCPGCSTEVAINQKALGHARNALHGPLAQEPPARIHAAVLEAAKVAAQAAPEPQTGRQEGRGFLARLWRTPWLMPAFGAATVATAVFLVRVLKNPEVVPGQQQRSMDERAVATPAPVVAPPETESAAATVAGAERGNRKEDLPALGRTATPISRERRAARTRSTAKGEAADLGMAHKRKEVDFDAPSGGLHGATTKGGGAPSRFAEPPPPRHAARVSGDVDDLLKSADEELKAAPAQDRAAPKPAAKKAPSAQAKETRSWDSLGGVAESSARVNRATSQQISDRGKYAVPPPAPAPASAPAPSPSVTASAATEPARPSVPSYAPASAVAQPAPSRSAKVRQAEPATISPAESTPETRFDDVMTKAEKSKDKAGPSLEESIRKADRLFAKQDWVAAAAAYRDLINRFPGHKDAGKWRERMGQSLVAEQESRNPKPANAAKAAKAKAASEVLEGGKP